MTDHLLSCDEVAAVTNLSVRTIRRAIAAGELAASRLRGRYRVHPGAIADWLEDTRVIVEEPVGGAVELRPRSRPLPPDGGFLADARRRRDAA